MAAALVVTDEVALPIRAVGDLAAAAEVSREEVAVMTQCASLGGKLPFDDASVGAVLAVIKNVESLREQLVAEISRVLKAGGRVLVQSPSPSSSEKPNTDIERKLLMGGFVGVQSSAAGSQDSMQSVTVKAQKASWSMGSSFPLKKPTRAPQIDDDSDLIDEDSLLTEDDLKKPQLPVVGDCEVGAAKKACANCTCGRAEAEAKVGKLELTAEQIDNPKSACGSCGLGDAFRCGTCPYRGLPPFKLGEKYSVGSEKAHYLVERHGEPMIDKETHRLAVVNMDWDHIKAVDLYMVMTSSLPKGGRVLSVAICPSELGLKCMENESTSSSKLSQLPAHELNRLRYYYAVVVCDSSATANHLYMTLDGNEFLETTNVLDLQFIPDSREFKHPARDVATEQCRVKLTSDDNEPEHKKVLRRKFTDDEGKKGKKGKDEVAEDKLPDIDLNKDDRLEKHMNSIKWGDKETFMFIRICAQEMIEKENRVGPPSLEMYQRIRAKLLEENINRTTSELKTKWKNTKKLYDFWMQKIQPKKVQERTDIFWKKILKTRCSKVDYKNLRNGPPAHLDLLHIMFGKELDKEQVSTATKKLKLDLNNELSDCKEQIVKPSDTLCLSVAKVSELEDLCNAQQEEILTLQKQLTLLSDKLKLADENAIEAMATCEQQKGKIKYLEERLTYAECQILKGHELRKKLHNTIMELKGNIRVFCRVRPLRFDGDSNSSESAAISFPTSVESAGRGIDLINQGKKLCFLYDKVFDHAATQQDVFVEISQLVQSALDGYKVCIFAYGQTGSGKTYTMMGKPDEKGIIPRSLEQIFKTRQSLESQGWNYSMKASMLEIYNETIRDLLIPRSNNLDMSSKQYKIEHDPHGNVAVSDLSVIDVFGIADVTILLKKASQSRSVGKTQMNEQSSRSHFVFTLKILGSNEKTGQHVQGALNLIDLAGSERLERSGAIGDRLKETKSINRSLSALSSVISAIARGDSHIPFRNSKLTQLLQPCLGGDSKTLMFVNISPEASSVGETISSLNFAERVNDCEIGPLRFAKRVDACDIGSPRHLTQSRLNYSKFKAKSSSHH